MDKHSIKLLEKNVLNNVIDKFIENKNKIIIDDIKETVKKQFFQDFSPVNSYSELFLYKASTFFFPFVKKIVSIIQYPVANKLSCVMQSIIDEVLITGSRIEEEELKIYFKQVLNFFAQKCIEFDEFIKKYPIIDDNHFLKEYFIACFVPIMLVPIAKINDFHLYEKIMKIWIVCDNLVDFVNIDSEIKNKIIKQCSPFLINKMYYGDCSEFFNIQGNPVIDCFKEIYDLEITSDIKNRVFNGLRKIYKFSYTVKGKKNDHKKLSLKQLLKYTCLKARKSIDVFANALDLDINTLNYIYRKEWNEEFMTRYYKISLGIQLLDDLLDVRKDIHDNCRSLFTINSKNDFLINAILVDELFKDNCQMVQYYFKTLQILFMSYNSKFMDNEVNEVIVENLKFINLKTYNIEIIFGLMEDRNFMINSWKAYLYNNQIEFVKMKPDEILSEMENNSI